MDGDQPEHVESMHVAERGRLLGERYRLGARLGGGGAGTVYAAVDTVLGREVAVKVYRPGSSAMSVYRFGAEARLLANLIHPALITVHDVCLDDDQPYIVMHLVHGTTLRDRLDRGPLDPITTARLGTRLADALAHIHEYEVVHRDVKPSNVLIDHSDRSDESGTYYLADFGLARALGGAHLTASGEFVGTAAYLAPEQLTDIDPGPPADIYALGLVLLECLTGKTEYTGTTVEAALARLTRRPHIPAELPPAWRSALAAMTQPQPADRPDATHCATLLAALTEQPPDVPARPDVLPPPTTPLASPPAASRPTRPAPERSGPLRRARLTQTGLIMAALAAVVTLLTTTSTTTIPGAPNESPRNDSPRNESPRNELPPTQAETSASEVTDPITTTTPGNRPSRTSSEDVAGTEPSTTTSPATNPETASSESIPPPTGKPEPSQQKPTKPKPSGRPTTRPNTDG